MNCYWLVNVKNPDVDKMLYTAEDYNLGQVVTVDSAEWRVIDKDANI